MTKTLSMGSHKHYNLGANDGFVMFLTSKVITCFTDSEVTCDWALNQMLFQYISFMWVLTHDAIE